VVLLLFSDIAEPNAGVAINDESAVNEDSDDYQHYEWQVGCCLGLKSIVLIDHILWSILIDVYLFVLAVSVRGRGVGLALSPVCRGDRAKQRTPGFATLHWK
jgi:hypothetical protein